MNVYKLPSYVLIAVCMILAACATPPPTEAATATSASMPTNILQPTTEVPTATKALTQVGQIISSVPSTIFPQAIYASQDGVWYWFEECGCVIRLDPVTGKEVASIQIGEGKSGPYGNPKGMVIDGRSVWVTDAAHSAVARLDPDTNQVVEEIPLEVTNLSGQTEQIQPFGLAIDGTTLWASDFDKGYVVRVDMETKKVVAFIKDIRSPEGIAINSEGVWVVEHRTDSIVRIDPQTNEVVATISIPKPENAESNGKCGMCIDNVVATDNAVWVPLDRGNGVARIDPNTNQVSAMIPLKFSPRALVVSEGAVWTAGGLLSPDCGSAAGGAVRIDPRTNTIDGMVSIPCAMSIALYNGSIWVGSGFPGQSTLITQIQPAD